MRRIHSILLAPKERLKSFEFVLPRNEGITVWVILDTNTAGDRHAVVSFKYGDNMGFNRREIRKPRPTDRKGARQQRTRQAPHDSLDIGKCNDIVRGTIYSPEYKGLACRVDFYITHNRHERTA